jgi:hypothetical protein
LNVSRVKSNLSSGILYISGVRLNLSDGKLNITGVRWRITGGLLNITGWGNNNLGKKLKKASRGDDKSSRGRVIHFWDGLY